MLDSISRFSNRVENYVKYRPHYPHAIVETLVAKCGLRRESVVADIGSGTGFLTELFVQNGNETFAVEPNTEMRAAAESLLGRYRNFHSIDGTAEATTLADTSADFVTAGQAFHWFDRVKCKAEFQRILRDDGWVAIIWNDRLTDTTPFLIGYEQLLHRFSTDYEKIDHRQMTDEVLAAFFEPLAFEKRTFPNNQILDFEGLKGRLLSSSYTPAPGQPGHEAMLAELKRLYDRYNENGLVNIVYLTEMYFGHLK